jgi:hypothetical protein
MSTMDDETRSEDSEEGETEPTTTEESAADEE